MIWFSRGRDSLKVKSLRGSRAVYESEEIRRVELKLETELGDKVTLEMTPQQCHRFRAGDREHIVQLNREETQRLRTWLERPKGGISLGRSTFEAVEGGGILVRTEPFSHGFDQRL